eukprot:scaffold1400_cov175-Amphora_coffeaeformis.AAC.4
MVTEKLVLLAFLAVSTTGGQDVRPERRLGGKMYSSKAPIYYSDASSKSSREKMHSSKAPSYLSKTLSYSDNTSSKGKGEKRFSSDPCSKSSKGSGGKMYSSCAPSYAPSLSDQPTMMPAEPTFVFASDLLLWKDHIAQALAQGCNLASIQNLEENQEATELIKKSGNYEFIFVGGLIRQSERVIAKSEFENWLSPGPEYWAWLDETTWDYENWNILADQPNSEDGNIIVALYGDDGSWGNISPESNFTALYRCSDDMMKREIP